MKKMSFTLGFTMIELLVVIAVIGILAAAVLSALNPIEQINKGRDTRARADAISLVQGSERYFAIQELYPWNVTGSSYTPTAALNGDPDPAFTSGFDGGGTALTSFAWVENLSSVDEVKQGYADRILDYSEGFLLVKPVGTNASPVACFIPTSNAFKQQAAEACGPSGNQAAAVGGVTVCSTTDGSVDDQNFLCVP